MSKVLWFLVCLTAFAEKASVKLQDIDTEKETSIVIKKDAGSQQCVEYQLIDGNEEVFGDSEFDKGKAMASWKAACKEWKGTLKELNKDNRIISLNCGAPKLSADEGNKFNYKSNAAYKIRVKTREKGER